jgi:hypothetical protein
MLAGRGGDTRVYRAVRGKDGSEIIVEANARGVKDLEGSVRYFEGFVDDITERRRVEIAPRQAKEAAEAELAIRRQPHAFEGRSHRHRAGRGIPYHWADAIDQGRFVVVR